MPEKPRLMWHADAEGKCTKKCAAWYRDCQILRTLPWVTNGPRPDPEQGDPCPFALLSSVLCCEKKQKPDRDQCTDCLNHRTMKCAPPFDGSPCTSRKVAQPPAEPRPTASDLPPACPRCKLAKMIHIVSGPKGELYRCPLCYHQIPLRPLAAPRCPNCCGSLGKPNTMVRCTLDGHPDWRCPICGHVGEGRP